METAASIIAWGAIVACIVATVLCATTYAKRHARLFTSLAFFAFGWALLLPYYGLQNYALQMETLPKGLSEIGELLPAYSGLLLTMAGGPLRREAVVREGHRDRGIGKHDALVLHALYFIALPHVLAVPGIPDIQYHKQFVMILGTGFTVLGFFSILAGLSRLILPGNVDYRPWLVFKAITILYVALELIYTGWLLANPDQPMPPLFKLSYAAFKLPFTALFLFLVVRQTRPRIRHLQQPGNVPMSRQGGD